MLNFEPVRYKVLLIRPNRPVERLYTAKSNIGHLTSDPLWRTWQINTKPRHILT
jgi:hypothetical protein